jgi:mono/diheme cytochrome c family protein
MTGKFVKKLFRLGACMMPALSGAIVHVAAYANPAEEFEKGRSQYSRTCAQCHGHRMANSGNTVYDLRKFPLDQQERFFNSVTNGKGNMPSFGNTISVEQIGAVWVYVKNRGISPE